ncbi:stage III sporulation protein AA [Pelagirhabdus alkalitolerans]|uniref:Stage III sporulation protein AA n=1 Tax=Pelagirhabdus alkalitolerans TaxID=1612202 RepID=A0A1G6I040_9BACI|nr:stage III sporulation protein AA [Pelagirhabdus alkalitolerans]SDB99892.1 stage III sporulation protein AA [Pelagirhabdus alkalitolerans]
MNNQTIVDLFPDTYQPVVEMMFKRYPNQIEEIRIRLNQPIEFVLNNQDYVTHGSSIQPAHCQYIFTRISGYSTYRLAEELKQGYITVKGGHRIGIVGQVVINNSQIEHLQNISSFNIRIAKESIGISESIIHHLRDNNRYFNTLLIGPPQSGKTTLLRDIARYIGSGSNKHPAQKVLIIDERSEIAGCVDGAPQFNLGRRTDVLDHCPKYEGMMLAIRSMSPDVLIVDEIGSALDLEAIQDCLKAGVTVFCSAHSDDLEQLKKRKNFQSIIDSNLFSRYVVINTNRRDQFNVFDQSGMKFSAERRVDSEWHRRAFNR